MQKGLTGKRPVKILDAANHVGVVSLLLFNNSGVNLYLGNDETSATIFNGVPIVPNLLVPGMLWEGELWIGADIDNTEFRYQISNPINFDNSQSNRNQSVTVTRQGFLSPRVLSILLLFFSFIGIPIIGKADQHFSATRQRDYFLSQAPWNQLSVGGVGGIKTFTINNLINTGQLFLHIENFDSSSHNVTITSILCGVDPLYSDYDTATNFQNKFLTLGYTYLGVQAISGVTTTGPNGQITILIPYVGCSSIHIRFSSADAVTTLVDVLYYINYQAAAYVTNVGTVLGASNPSVIQGLFAGTPISLRVNGSGALELVAAATVGDGYSNALIGGSIDLSGGIDISAIAPFLYNGTTWDRGFYCPITKIAANIVATTSQIVPLSAGTKIRICSIIIERNDVTGVATTLKLVEGTGANCATGQTSLTGNLFTSGATAVTTDSPPVTLAFGNTAALITNVVADAVCVQTTGAGSSFDVTITEGQY